MKEIEERRKSRRQAAHTGWLHGRGGEGRIIIILDVTPVTNLRHERTRTLVRGKMQHIEEAYNSL